MNKKSLIIIVLLHSIFTSLSAQDQGFEFANRYQDTEGRDVVIDGRNLCETPSLNIEFTDFDGELSEAYFFTDYYTSTEEVSQEEAMAFQKEEAAYKLATEGCLPRNCCLMAPSLDSFYEAERIKYEKKILRAPQFSRDDFDFGNLHYQEILFPSSIDYESVKPSNYDLKCLQARLNEFRKRKNIPGMFVSLVTRDSVLLEKGFGWADIEQKRPVDEFTRFRLGSFSKGILSLAMLKLVREGKFTLETPVKKLAPELPIKNKWESTHPVTVGQLLEHTTGFDEVRLHALFNRKDSPDCSLKQAIERCKTSLITRWQPGERYGYSNPGYLVAGYLIEKYSGMDFEDFVKKEVLNPIGMEHTTFQSTVQPDENFSKGYYNLDEEKTAYPFLPIYVRPGGGMNSCAHDMGRYLQFLLNDGNIQEHALFSKGEMERWENPATSLGFQSGLEQGYGLGIYLFPWQVNTIRGHGGAMPGFTGFFAYSRELNMGFVIAANSQENLGELIGLLFQHFIKDKAPEIPEIAPLDSAIAQTYSGYYLLKNPPMKHLGFLTPLISGCEVKLDGDDLYMKFQGKPAMRLLPVKKHLFRMENEVTATISFTKDSNGRLVMIGQAGMEHYEKVNYNGLKLLRWSMIFAVIFGLISIPVGIMTLISWRLHDLPTKEFMPRLLSAIGSGIFIGLLMILNETLTEPLSAGMLTTSTLSFYIGSLLFAGISMGTLGWVIRDFFKFENRGVAVYNVLVALSLAFFAVYMWVHDLIGLRFWDY